ncbi:MAG: hypothetical protein SGI87_07000 [Flavobacteriales bacterium]|nr:hypothetical protein [Flavobacteriales bacterium]
MRVILTILPLILFCAGTVQAQTFNLRLQMDTTTIETGRGVEEDGGGEMTRYKRKSTVYLSE